MAKKSTSHQVVTVAVVAIVSILGIVMFMGNQTATGAIHGGGWGGWSAPSWNPPSCIDGDGSNAYTPGIMDRCIDVDTVSEYYCSGSGRGISRYIDCAGGTVCLTDAKGQGYCGTPVAAPRNSSA